MCCFVELESHRICQEAHRNDHTGDNCQNDDPESRLLVVHHRLHTLLYTDLTKGKRAGCDHTAVDTTGHKRLGIVGSLLVAQYLNDLLITGQLNVPAQQHIGQPHQRIEPMDRQQ